MLLLLIPILWLAIVAFIVLLCRGAARADAVTMATPTFMSSAPRTTRRGALTLFEARRGVAPGNTRPREAGFSRVRGVRGRGGRCVAGS